MRLFIAIQLSDEMRSELTGAQTAMRKGGVKGNYSPEGNLHLTLAFIGEYDQPDRVSEVIESVKFDSFTLKLSGFGTFGDLWWAGLERSDALNAYVKRLRHALSDAGIPFDSKRFTPHITLIRRAEGKFPDLSAPQAEMTADTVSLMRSDRGEHGMIYTELYSIRSSELVYNFKLAQSSELA